MHPEQCRSMVFWEPWWWSPLASVLPLSLRPMPPWVSSAGMCGSCTLLLASSLPKSFSISPCPVRCVVEGPASWRVICGWWEHHPGTTFISWPSPPALETKLRVVSECFGHCFFFCFSIHAFLIVRVLWSTFYLFILTRAYIYWWLFPVMCSSFSIFAALVVSKNRAPAKFHGLSLASLLKLPLGG